MDKADLKLLIRLLIKEGLDKRRTKEEDDAMNQQMSDAKDGPARATLIYNWVKSNKLTLDEFQQWCALEFDEQ